MSRIVKRSVSRYAAFCLWAITCSLCAPAQAGSTLQQGLSVVANLVVPTVVPGANPFAGDVQVNTKTNRVYVTGSYNFEFQSNSMAVVTVFDGATDQVITNVAIAAGSQIGATQSCVDDATNTVYTLLNNGLVATIDGSTNTVTGSFAPLPVSTVTAVDGIVCNPSTGKLYMVLWNPGPQVVVWDTRKHATVAVITTPANHLDWLAANHKTNKIYAAADWLGEVFVIDGASDRISAVITDVGQTAQPAGCDPFAQSPPFCTNPSSQLEWVAVNEATNRIYVVGETDGVLTMIDGSKNKVIAKKYFDDTFYSLVADPARNMVYALDPSLNLISVIDGAVGERTQNIPPLFTPFPIECTKNADVNCLNGASGFPYTLGYGGMAVNPITGKVYAAYSALLFTSALPGEPYSTSYLSVLTPTVIPAQNAPSHSHRTPKENLSDTVTLAAGTEAVDTAVNTRTNTLFTANSGTNSVTAVNLGSLSPVGTIPVGASPQAITINEPGSRLYTFNADGSVSVLNSASYSLVGNFPVDSNASGLLGLDPTSIVYSLQTGKLYAINGFNQIDVIDPIAQKVLTTLDDPDASRIAISQTTNTIYVSQYSSGEVWIVNGWSDQRIGVIQNVGLPAEPAGCFQGPGAPISCLQMSSGLTSVAVDEALNRVYVLGRYDGRVVAVDGNANRVIGDQFINAGDYGLAVDPKTHRVFADNFFRPALWVLDGQNWGQSQSVVDFNSLFCNTSGTSCFNQTDLKNVTVNTATGSIYVLDQGDLNPQNASLIYVVNPPPSP